jgi:hypothetical protein
MSALRLRHRTSPSLAVAALACVVAVAACGGGGSAGAASRCLDLYNDERYEEALTACDAAIKEDEESLNVRLARAIVLGELGRETLAIADLTRIVEADSDSGLALALRGQIFASIGANEQAMDDLTDASRLISSGHLGDTNLQVEAAEVLASIANTIDDVAARPAPTHGPDTPALIETPWPMGRLYHDGDDLVITISYVVPPEMKNVSAAFHGVHGPGSPWFEHWCTQTPPPASCARDISSGFDTEVLPLTGTTGIITLRAIVGSFPPESAGSPPSLEGFVVCDVAVIFDDGVWGGALVRQELGEGC